MPNTAWIMQGEATTWYVAHFKLLVHVYRKEKKREQKVKEKKKEKTIWFSCAGSWPFCHCFVSYPSLSLSINFRFLLECSCGPSLVTFTILQKPHGCRYNCCFLSKFEGVYTIQEPKIHHPMWPLSSNPCDPIATCVHAWGPCFCCWA